MSSNTTAEQYIMEKLATRAWKKHWGELSQGAQNQLVRKNILNRAKELEGLEKGTANILKKTNSIITDNPKKAAIHAAIHAGGPLAGVARYFTARKAAKNSSGFTVSPRAINKTSFKSDVAKIRDQIRNKTNEKNNFKDIWFATNAATNMNSIIKNNAHHTVFVPNKDAVAKNLNKTLGLKKNSKKAIKSDFDKKYLHALVKRHEAYETAAAAKKSKTGEIDMRRSVSTHYSTYVPMMESKDVAIAPRKVKDLMTNVRKNYTGELNRKNKYMGGFEYAKTAVPEKKIARGVDKTVRNNFDRSLRDKHIEESINNYIRTRKQKKK